MLDCCRSKAIIASHLGAPTLLCGLDGVPKRRWIGGPCRRAVGGHRHGADDYVRLNVPGATARRVNQRTRPCHAQPISVSFGMRRTRVR